MTRILFALLGAVVLAAFATSGPAQAIKYYPGKNGTTITCTIDDCKEHCVKNGGRPAGCPPVCQRLINDRKASGECK